jgi:hypothetical protein
MGAHVLRNGIEALELLADKYAQPERQAVLSVGCRCSVSCHS